MTNKKKQETGTGGIAVGSGIAGYGAYNAPVLRNGYKDKSKMSNASPKKQEGRYQGELHNAMKAGKVPSDSTVRVLRTPSGRHINAGGTHRHIAREAMGQSSRYEIKDIPNEIRVSPAQKIQGKMRIGRLKRASRRAEAGKPTKPISDSIRAENRRMAAGADVGDDAVWKNPRTFARNVRSIQRANLASAGMVTATGLAIAGTGLHDRKKWKQSQKKAQVKKGYNVSAFGVEHG